MESPSPLVSADSQPAEATRRPAPTLLPWWAALAQVLLVCGIPTQLAIFQVLGLVVHPPAVESGQISFEVFTLTSLLDTAFIALLIQVFLGLSGESSWELFVRRRPLVREGALGLALVPLVYVVVACIALGLRTVAPRLHTVPTNPYDAYMRTPFEAGVFAIVVVLAGGVREEMQRAFILHRFEQRLGGAWVGLAVFSVFFGALHLTEGADAAIAVGILGLFWGLAYLRRRSILLPMVNHAGFDLLQIVQVVLTRGLT